MSRTARSARPGEQQLSPSVDADGVRMRRGHPLRVVEAVRLGDEDAGVHGVRREVEHQRGRALGAVLAAAAADEEDRRKEKGDRPPHGPEG